MSIGSRSAGYMQQQTGVKFLDITQVPPNTGDPTIFRVGDIVYLMDADGNLHPLIPGVDGAGVVEIDSAEETTYTVAAQDEVLLVDTATAAVTITLPSAGRARPLLIIQLGANNVNVLGNGKNINGNPDMTMNALYMVRELTYVAAFGAVSAQYIITKAVL